MRNVKILEPGKCKNYKLNTNIMPEPSMASRYAAMKKYFTYTGEMIATTEIVEKPCLIDFEGNPYTSFTNSWSLILTKENTGEIELFDKEKSSYPDVARFLQFGGVKRKVDFNEVFSEAKHCGYMLRNSEFTYEGKYYMFYDGDYYKIALLEISYSIIDNGKPALVYHSDGENMPLIIQNNLGFCIIMPTIVNVWDIDIINIVL